MEARHFLTLSDLNTEELGIILARAKEMKKDRKQGVYNDSLRGKTLAQIFEKSSTRTRVSFEAGMTQLGGNSMFLSPRDTQLGRGEPVEDTARVISRMVDVVVIRTDAHEKLETFAQYSCVPVVNALTDLFHPCQLLADVLTYQEHRGDITGKHIAWVGDGNYVCHSWMKAATLLDFKLCIATPESHKPDKDIATACKDHIEWTSDPDTAVSNADVVVTDTWASMGQEQEKRERETIFKDYQVNQRLMSKAKTDALFMHCLPAYRGSEVTAEVIDGPQSVVWDEAENRLHSQKALLEFLLT
jgi:ornithine carbamoyltransferase